MRIAPRWIGMLAALAVLLSGAARAELASHRAVYQMTQGTTKAGAISPRPTAN